MNRRALQYALEACRRFRVVDVRGDEIAELIVDVVQNLTAQAIEVDTARAQRRDRILILGKREQKVFERGIFVPALIGVSKRAVKSYTGFLDSIISDLSGGSSQPRDL